MNIHKIPMEMMIKVGGMISSQHEKCLAAWKPVKVHPAEKPDFKMLESTPIVRARFASRLWEKTVQNNWLPEMAITSTVLTTVTVSQVIQQPDTAIVNSLTLGALLMTFGYVQLTIGQSSNEEIGDGDVVLDSLKYMNMAKEALWISVFGLSGLYAAMVAPLIFATYPSWRKILPKLF